jgi:hypothetical protein
LPALAVTAFAYTAVYAAFVLRSSLLSGTEKAALAGLVRRATQSARLAVARA